MKRLARTPYMRNLWHIMKTFSVLPTNKDFRNLTDAQIDLMIYSFEEDARELDLARRGLSVDSQYYDTDFDEEVWNKAPGEWEVLREGHDPDDIARQVEALTREEDLKNLAMKFDSLEEYNAFLEAGGKNARETEVEAHINRQLALAQEKARRLEAVGGKKELIDDRDRPEVGNTSSQGDDNLAALDKAAMDKAIALFNSKNQDDDDDDFTVL